MPSGLADRRIASGKVRELYDAGDGLLLLVASDRISAFDEVLPTPVPGKGRVLTALTLHWLAATRQLVANHLVAARPDGLPSWARTPELAGRAMLCRRLEMLPVECVVRGYLAGSGWRDYEASGTVSGHALPAGLRRADRLPAPIFTPARKAASGHDENLTVAEAAELLGQARYVEVERVSLALYALAAARALDAGIVIADTKFEFGLDGDGTLVLADEVLTPDSSRFWPADGWAPGGSPPSFDKQYVRDWLETLDWDKTAPGPVLPDDVVAGVAARYREAYAHLTGRDLDDYLREMGVPG